MILNDFFWWLGAGILIVAELFTGTFYLLMIALGFLAGALAHLLGVGITFEFAVAALVALAAVIVLRRSPLGRRRQRRDVSANPDVNLDIGATLEIGEWHARCALSSTVGSEAWNSRDLKSRPH